MNLPEQYTYLPVKNDENNKIYRVKEITSGCAAEVWVHKFSKQSYFTWRVMKTYPKAGRKNIYRKDYRCQHLTDKRAIGAGPSKNTDCPAKLEVFVKRYVENTRSKNVDSLIKEYPGMIILKSKHNHPIYSADTLHHIDMSPETEEKRDMSPETEEKLDMSPETEEQLDMSPETEEKLDMSPETEEKLDMSPETEEKLDMSPETEEKLDMSPETKEKLSALFHQGHSPSSARYLLNIDLMMNSAENYDKFAADGRYLPTLSTVTKLFQKEFVSAESALASALDTFGKYSGVKAATLTAAKQLLRRSHKTVIGVQPTADACKKILLSGRKKLNVKQPTGVRGPPRELSHHNHTSFSVLPKRKRKAPHNLDQCIYDNKSLGGH